ncbi:MAG: hypothetical protein NW206_06655 [Hyphomonadaceae bacterium]|nr:hypothetical protein [Hyphomonadaceae bacterium]
MRVLLCLIALAACSPAPPPEPTTAPAPLPPAAWAICDAIDQPAVFVLAQSPSSASSTLTEISKSTGAETARVEIVYAESEGAAGNMYTPFTAESQDAGHLRLLNAGMLETPGAAYTPALTSLQFRGTDAQCRWLPRTRLVGVTEKRSLVIHEDADGDLIYTTFDFSAGLRPAIELSDNGRSTVYSAEVRGGEEHVEPGAIAFKFAAPEGYEYRVRVDGQGPRLEVSRAGALVQTEAMLAYELGQAE